MLHAIETSAWSGDRSTSQAYLATATSWLDEDDEAPMSHARATVALAEARVHYYALEYDAARMALSRALSIARVGQDDLLVLQCESFEADVAFYQDRFADAERIARSCEARASMDDPDLAAIGASAAQRLADLAALTERTDDAISCWERCHRYRLAAGLPWRARIALLNLAESFMVVGRLDEAGAVLNGVRAEATAAHDDEGLGCCVDLEARLAFLRGDPEGARAVMVPRASAVDATGDEWRRTMLLAFLALLSASLDSDAVARDASRAFTRAYRRVPHDEAFTIHAMRLLVDRLSARGLDDAAADVRAVIALRQERVRRGMSA
jgi:ATP/maltotriose-dependent transcriptional regulator MalT